MTLVNFVVPVGDAELVVHRDMEMFSVRVGKWMVEVIGGELVVREPNKPVNETPLLKVPA